MPFNVKALVELLKRENISEHDLSKRLMEQCPPGIANSTIYHILGGRRSGGIKTMDALYKYALSRKYRDLEFYVKPKIKGK